MSLLSACILTIVIETAFFACTRYRRRPLFLLLCVSLNGATNLGMNLLLIGLETLSERMETGALFIFGFSPSGFAYWFLALLEAIVIVVEYLVYRSFCNGSGKRKGAKPSPRDNRNLLLLTIAANLLSVSVGLLLVS